MKVQQSNKSSSESRNLKIAGFNIRIDFYPEDNIYFKQVFIKMIASYSSFFSSSKHMPDFVIKVMGAPVVDLLIRRQGRLENIHKFSSSFYPRKKTLFTTYFISSMEFEMILKKILAEYLLPDHGAFIHGSACRFRNSALLFLGESGAGKSTIAQMTAKKMATLADDIFIIKKEKDRVLFFQTPFHEKNWKFKRSKNALVIRAIFLLQQATKTRIDRITDKEQLLILFLSQIIEGKRKDRKNITELGKITINTIPISRLYFSLNETAVLKEINHNLS